MMKFVVLYSLALWSIQEVFGEDNIRGTFWADRSDAGGCQVPEGNYRIWDAIALGQESNLGSLIWRQGLCGQVLDVDCGNGVVPAVVVSTCNLGSGSCGVDMIRKTWDKATGWKPPGVVQCRVSLSRTNPLNEEENVCYHRPNSDIGNKYFTIVGMLNTSGRITRSANIDGVEGTRGNDGWFIFNSGGRPLFEDWATLTFIFEDGGSVQRKLSECRNGRNTQIFA
ncbi:uncharacterized protein LOC129569349 [Sitodiplosis mosellana]|uniref:uncharacterized protein LOC129569349 n=1 Tax=Sitodiplosis mosellana TaxID=263140 RepID=UPI0024445973|nr:uncharacterized protein LOC129569349 [Sitodiplosis mosellana]